MQITRVEVVPVELNLLQPIQLAHTAEIESVTAIFVRFETQQGEIAWGCTVSHPELTGDEPQEVIRICQECAALVPDLHPTNIEYSLSQLVALVMPTPTALCAFDLAFHDLLGKFANLPLYKILGGYRNRIQTSVTVPIASIQETVEMAEKRAKLGFRIIKIKGGLDAQEDVRKVRAVQRVLPELTIRLDVDGGYDPRRALDVTRALEGKLEMLEQPTPPDDLNGLAQVTRQSGLPILADQSVKGPETAQTIATQRISDGLSIKLTTCGGIRPAREIVTLARVARLTTMISCMIEPSLLIAAGLSIALSSPSVQYADLDGHLNLVYDPSTPSFQLHEGFLIASEQPGLGCTVDALL